MISFVLFFRVLLGILGYLVGGNREEAFRELEKVLGGTHASSKIITSVGYAGGLDESCRTLWLLVIAHNVQGNQFLVSIVLLKFRCSSLLSSACSRGEYLAGWLL